MSLDSLLNDTATVEEQTATRDTSGGVTRAWSTLYDGVAVRIEDANAATVMAYQSRGQVVTHTVFSRQSGVGVQHRFLSSDGRYMLVKGQRYHRAAGGIDDYYQYDAEEYRPGA